jgi:hypothetical protein
MQRIEIFRPGSHTAMNGQTIGFTEADLRASAAAYDPKIHEAPMVIGHPKHDGPAYGWVKSLAFGETLEAEPDQIEPQFSEMVIAGRFKKVSAAFYRPDSPANPVPGVYYLRHVGFLGAQPPAIKGLKQIEFADGDSDIVEVAFGEPAFGEVRPGVLQRLFRQLREMLISDKGQEAADRILPNWDIDNLEEQGSHGFSEPDTGTPHQPENTPEVTDVDKQELERERQKIEEREARVKEQEAAFAERTRLHQAEDSARLIDQLVKDGRVLPKHRDGLVAYMASQNGDDALEFGEGDGKVKTTSRAFIEGFLKELPQSVDYGERAAGEAEADEIGDFHAPNGYQANPDKVRLHRQALAYQERNDCDYVTAVRAVQRGGAS